jgi:hypothetical protein
MPVVSTSAQLVVAAAFVVAGSLKLADLTEAGQPFDGRDDALVAGHRWRATVLDLEDEVDRLTGPSAGKRGLPDARAHDQGPRGSREGAPARRLTRSSRG